VIELAFQVRNGIKSARVPRVTSKNAAQAQPAAIEKAMAQERLTGVAGTRWLKTAATTGAKQQLLHR
jgi:hypothetical protein